jgi:hypothetical protein
MFLTAQSPHRPLHSKLILNSEWNRMSEEAQKRATQEGKLKLPSPKQYKSMTREEISKWKADFKPILEEIKENVARVFRNIPTSLLFVMRYFPTQIY